MNDVEIVMAVLPRLRAVCKARDVAPPGSDGGGSVSDHQARILTYLDAEDPVMVTELADYAGVTPSTMSLTLGRLERAGLVTRARDPDDRRVMNVLLTEEGVRVRDRASELDPGRVDALLGALRPVDRRRAVEGLGLLAEAADAMVARTDAYVASLTGRKL